MERGKSAWRYRGAPWRRPWQRARLVVAALVTVVAATTLPGCASISQKFAASMSQMPAIGLPSDAPERPSEPTAYPAVHDIPPPRNSITLTSIEQQKLEDDLLAARDQQQSGVGMKLQPKSKKQLRRERELKSPPQQAQPLPPQQQALPLEPVSSSRSIY